LTFVCNNPQAGLLGDRSVFAHCTYLLSEDFDRIRASGSSIAHCPLSNVYFSDEPFPLREALERELKVGLGSDVAGGYSLDMMLAMRTAVAVSRMRNSAAVRNGTQEPVNLSIDWKESLYLATAGGSGVLSSVSNRLSGTLAVGAPFDAQLS
jgi:guanine deaminase